MTYGGFRLRIWRLFWLPVKILILARPRKFGFFATGRLVIAVSASERRFRNLTVEGMFAYKVKTVQEIRLAISLVDSSGRNP